MNVDSGDVDVAADDDDANDAGADDADDGDDADAEVDAAADGDAEETLEVAVAAV